MSASSYAMDSKQEHISQISIATNALKSAFSGTLAYASLDVLKQCHYKRVLLEVSKDMCNSIGISLGKYSCEEIPYYLNGIDHLQAGALAVFLAATFGSLYYITRCAHSIDQYLDQK